MSLALYLLAGVSFVEILLWLSPLWSLRRVLICILIPVLAVVSGLIFGEYMTVWAGLILLASIYRMVNLLRILEDRLQAKYLYQASRRTSYWLIGLQLIILGVVGMNQWHPMATIGWLYGLVGLQLAVALILTASTLRHLRTTQPPTAFKKHPDSQLPTLTVAIPARNETDELEACLRSLVDSDYPKLEILVLDDCSQNRHTPQIIRDYAHSGVRFMAGTPPPPQWLAKNWAYDQLADEANGELLLFCGVDCRFRPGSLRAIAEIMLAKQKRMVSFVPANQPPQWWQLENLMIQPARYAWELSLPRRLLSRPPVLSTCWLITAKTLRAAGGFEGSRRSISPESHLARYAAQHDDGYSFLRSNETTGLTSAKNLGEQRATAIRTRYPQLHRRPELVALFMATEIATLIGPVVIFIIGLATQEAALWLTAATSLALMALFFSRVTSLTYRRFLLRGVWLLPFVALYDVALLNYSMWQYEFREVIWKGRNICLPVMTRAEESKTT